MKVKINNYLYEDVQWDNGILTMETDMTLAQIEAAFTPGMDSTIIVYDGDEEIAKYFNKGLSSIKVNGTVPRTVTVEFDLSRIEEDAAEELASLIEESNDAILELGELIAEFEESKSQYDGYQEDIEALQTWKNQIDANEIPAIIQRLERLENTVFGGE